MIPINQRLLATSHYTSSAEASEAAILIKDSPKHSGGGGRAKFWIGKHTYNSRLVRGRKQLWGPPRSRPKLTPLLPQPLRTDRGGSMGCFQCVSALFDNIIKRKVIEGVSKSDSYP